MTKQNQTKQPRASYTREFREESIQIRRGLHHELKDAMSKDVLKGTRWILLEHPENLSVEHKEELRQFWSQPDKEAAKAAIDSWIERAVFKCPVCQKRENRKRDNVTGE